MYHELQGRLHILRFDSVADLTDVLPIMHKRPYAQRLSYFGEAYLNDQDDFIGRQFASWQAVIEAADEAWPEGLAIVDRMLQELADDPLPKPTSRRRTTCYREDDGDEIDMDRLRAGRPYWRTSYRASRAGPATVTIVTDVSTSCFVDSSKILWRGAAAVTLAKTLEEAGYRVELWAVNHVTRGFDSGKNLANGVCLKRPGDPLDLASLTNAVSGWFFRTLFFASFTAVDNETPDSGLGRPTPIREVVPHFTPDEKALVTEGIWSHEEAVTWLKIMLEGFLHPEWQAAG